MSCRAEEILEVTGCVAKQSEQNAKQAKQISFDPRSSSHVLCSLGLSVAAV